MVSKLRLVFTITIVFFSFYGTAQNAYWQQQTSRNGIDRDFSERFEVQKGTVFSFDEASFKSKLVPSSSGKGNFQIVYFPDLEGRLVAYQVLETPALSPELSRKYPEIKSYSGHAVNGTRDKIRFSVSQNGIQSMVVPSDGKANTYMQKDKNKNYVLYSRAANSNLGEALVCATEAMSAKNTYIASSGKPVGNQVLRRFRLAVSASGEYTDFHGGTKADALAAINATITRVNAVFETDLAVTFELIAATNEVIFTDAATDPYNGGSTGEAQRAFTDIIGEANYDLGILFNKIENVTDNNGNAGGIGTVCRNDQKGSAFVETTNPEGDTFDLDFVAHEIGHQLGANHTWSHRDEFTADDEVQVEPASGTTIMGYAGIVGNDNVASNGDDYFHYVSLVQMSDYLATVACGEIINLTNEPPVVNPTGAFTIPKSTAFLLTADATDADGSDMLTYSWEQIDDGIVTQASFGPENVDGALFRSQKPSISPERYFPELSRVIFGNLTQTNPGINTAWETVSNVERELNFAVTVRDNSVGGGQVASDLVNVFVSRDAGPFVVTSQADSFSTIAGSVESITWDVANTVAAPINAELVDIFLSVDGGLTFPIILAEDVANDGEHSIIVPANPTTEARIMIKASGNIFFAVNAADFTITASEIVLDFTELNYEICQPDTLIVPFEYKTYLGFSEEVTFSINDLPVGLDVAFSPVTATGNTPVSITFTTTQNLMVATYPITVLATSASNSKELPITLEVFDTDFSSMVLIAPTNESFDVSNKPTLQWEEQLNATSYEIEIATDIAFDDIVETAEIISNSYEPKNLENGASYLWRVKPGNSCAEGVFSAPFGFSTIVFNCVSNSALGLPQIISSTGRPTVTSKIAFFEDIPLADIKVSLELDHSDLKNITATLTSPSGTMVNLFQNICGSRRNVNAIFDEEGLPLSCEGEPAIKGTVRPTGTLNSFKGESLKGEWVLTVSDNMNRDGGSLKAFSLEVCVEGTFRPDEDEDGVFDDGPDLCLGTPNDTPVDATGCPAYVFPVDAFSVRLQSESCATSNDGLIAIGANQTLDYSIQITGNGSDINADFTTEYIADGLRAGTYSVCINATDDAIVYEERCFELVISEPEALDVSSKISLDARIVELDLTGGRLYNVELNGVVTQTQDSKIILDLEDGANTLKVTTDLPCQGTYEERLFVSDGPVVYPNPFVDLVHVSFRREVTGITAIIFSADGKQVHEKRYPVNGVDMKLDLSNLPVGLYHLRLTGEDINKTVKLLKR